MFREASVVWKKIPQIFRARRRRSAPFQDRRGGGAIFVQIIASRSRCA
ncbi:hypothetical protein [Roseovarius spongiae]|nr:hypothetical protein [Roseovarius spongiae]